MKHERWLDSDGVFLGSAAPVPLDRPFTWSDAERNGVSRRQLNTMVALGLLRRPVRGVYVASQVVDSVALRCAALKLVLDPDVVVADRAAGWLHGLPVLRRGSHLKAPPIEVCHRTDTRSTHGVADGHRRMLANRDIETLHGLRVTTLPRTCLDLGRLTWRYDAIAALDSGLRAGLSRQSLRDDARRFRGFRGVRQLRALLEIADGASESPGESALRLHWHEAGLPAPESQIWLTMGEQRIYRLDLGSRRARFAAEFDGEKFHTETEDRTYDEKRRARIESEFGWMIEVFTREIYRDLVGTQERLRRGYAQALRRDARWSA